MNHLNTHALLLKSQHGFTNLTSSFLFLEAVNKAIDECKPLGVIYLDFSKAFDNMPHKRLMHKIESHGISCNVAAWIGEWLCDRKQKVVLNGETSRLQDVLSGCSNALFLGQYFFDLC